MGRRLTCCRMEGLEIRTLLAQVGLDLGFGNGGRVGVGLIAQLTDGKILAVTSDNSIVRLNADGSVDPSFQFPAGVVGRNFVTASEQNATRLFSYGEIDTQLLVHAFHRSDGTPDTTFAANGTATFDNPPLAGLDPGSPFIDARGTPDGGLLLNDEGKLYKITPAGKIDTAFGKNGILTLVTGPDVADQAEFDVTPDGKIVALDDDSEATGVTLDRFNADGTPDTTFGTNGMSGGIQGNVQFPYNYRLYATPDDGALVLIASGADGYEPDSIGRVSSDGNTSVFAHSLDPNQDNTTQLFVQGDGKVLGVAGATLFRFNSDGSADTSFDNDGVVWTGGNAFYDVQSIATDANGDILLGGANANSGTTSITRFAALTTGAQLEGGQLQINGTGNADTITVDAAADQITVTLNGEQSTFAAADVTSIVIQSLDGNDIVTNNTSLRSTIYGGEGDDTITGGSARDSLLGQGGNDRISGLGGNDIITGESGRDTLNGNGGSDQIWGGSSNDLLRGGTGRDHLHGGTGNDRIYGGSSGDWLYGGGGSDQLFGDGGNDRLYAGFNDPNLEFTPSTTLHGGTGNDTLVSDKNDLVDYLFGDAGHDTASADTTVGGYAIDILTSIEASI